MHTTSRFGLPQDRLPGGRVHRFSGRVLQYHEYFKFDRRPLLGTYCLGRLEVSAKLFERYRRRTVFVRRSGRRDVVFAIGVFVRPSVRPYVRKSDTVRCAGYNRLDPQSPSSAHLCKSTTEARLPTFSRVV